MRDFSAVSRLVVKVGTNILAPGGQPSLERIAALAEDASALRQSGLNVIVVSSGAIGFGGQSLGLAVRPRKVEMRQACAAVGQPVLMNHWRNAFSRFGVSTAQILLRRENFDERRSFLNLRNTVENLLKLGVIPILNENDCVSTDEIGDVFGDNDSLSAHVASKLDAGMLILLTDIDAFYDKDPRRHPGARPIRVVEELNDSIRQAAGQAGSANATGGMRTKIRAIEVASRAGCATVLAHGGEKNILGRIVDGEELGTFFPAGNRIKARARWILGARTRGRIQIDSGAREALRRRKSLLPSGVCGVEGLFRKGDIVRIGDDFQAVAALDSEEIRRIMGMQSSKAKDLLEQDRGEMVAHADDIIALNR